MTAPTVVERMTIVANSPGLPGAIRAGILALLERIDVLEAQVFLVQTLCDGIETIGIDDPTMLDQDRRRIRLSVVEVIRSALDTDNLATGGPTAGGERSKPTDDRSPHHLAERVAELEAEVAQLRSPEWQQEQIDAYHDEVGKLRAKREKLYE